MKKILLLVLLLGMLSACVRVSGNAGYWKQGDEDEPPAGKSVGFDTADFVPGSPAPGNIET